MVEGLERELGDEDDWFEEKIMGTPFQLLRVFVFG